jgi:hypothetical protein
MALPEKKEKKKNPQNLRILALVLKNHAIYLCDLLEPIV